jgi:hypothetical protein
MYEKHNIKKISSLITITRFNKLYENGFGTFLVYYHKSEHTLS